MPNVLNNSTELVIFNLINQWSSSSC